MFMRHDQQYYSSNLDGYIVKLNAGERRVISQIYCVLGENSPEDKGRAARVLAGVLKNLSLDDILRVDQMMRETTSMEWFIDWRKLHIEDLVTTQMSREEIRTVAVFSTFNPNGFIRQRAVEALVSFESTLPFIMVRLNDWVNNVRQAALVSFSKRLKVASEQELLLAMPMMEKLRRSERCDYSEICSLFAPVINDSGNKHILVNGLNDEDPRIRRFCCRILLDSPDANAEILRQYVVRERVPFSRRIVFEALIDAEAEVADLADLFLADKFPGNRYLALQYLHKAGRDDIFRKAESLLLDRSATVRELARSIVREIDPCYDLPDFYMKSIRANPVSSILGLGEVGSPVVCETIEKYLYCDKVSVIRAAMISLMRLDAPRHGRVILELLLSEQTGIVKTARSLIQKYTAYDYPRIYEIYQNTPYENTKLKCIALLFSAGKWERVIYILRILSDGNPRLEALSQSELYKWYDSYNRSYVVATEEQKAITQDLLDRNKDRLSAKLRCQLLFLMK